MKKFMDKDFLLNSDCAGELFHTYAEDCPIYDYHNHLSTEDIAKRRVFKNMTELWLECDHYKWRGMRQCGVDEKYITGDAPDREKFLAWASVMPKLVGSPLYHWTHLELQRYFDYYEPLSEKNALEVWELGNERLKSYDAVSFLEHMNVKALCTTDDPADSLCWHKAIRDAGNVPFKVLPSFRPDKYIDLDAPDFRANAEKLGNEYGVEVKDLDSLKEALSKALDRFVECGVRVSDHGFSRFSYVRGTEKAELLHWLGCEYAKRGIAMQCHLGPIRNQSPRLLSSFGPDAGADSVGLTTDPYMLGAFLGDLEKDGALPKTVLYNLNPAENAVISTMAATFAPKAQYGAAWWFSDTLRGMERQIDELLETASLSASVGMLTDSRSFSSFARHEYYRRILCNKLGELVESGQYPADTEGLGKIVQDVCCNNAKNFFDL
ncbi:MAG: glucuronate isomerase [Eubacteriales bacterium]|nr:glucuronate isomerase [Eubacteriales bacterium]